MELDLKCISNILIKDKPNCLLSIQFFSESYEKKICLILSSRLYRKDAEYPIDFYTRMDRIDEILCSCRANQVYIHLYPSDISDIYPIHWSINIYRIFSTLFIQPASRLAEIFVGQKPDFFSFN